MMKDVWSTNLDSEMCFMGNRMHTHPMIALDAEFPAFQRNRHMSAPEHLRYGDLMFNVNNSKLIQLGFTLFNEKGEIGGSWQINFSRKRNMNNLERQRDDWVDPAKFAKKFNVILSKHRKNIGWVTFHGIYDVAYLSTLLINQEIPSSELVFTRMVGEVLGTTLFDVKLLAGQSEYLGLQKLSEKLLVERIGQAHQAGSDSLLTAEVFLKLTRRVDKYFLNKFEGYLFGISIKIENPVMFRSEASRTQTTLEKRREIKFVRSVEGSDYPLLMVSRQFYGPQKYYVVPSGCHQLMPTVPCYRVPSHAFYPHPTYIAMHDIRAPLFI